MDWLVEHSYRPTLDRALRWRYTTVAVAVGLLMLSLGYVASGRLKFSFFPPVEGRRPISSGHHGK